MERENIPLHKKLRFTIITGGQSLRINCMGLSLPTQNQRSTVIFAHDIVVM